MGKGTDMNDFLELKNVTKRYTGVVALNDVSIRFSKGEIHALVGENGAGKSTLIKVLTGAIAPTEGTIAFLGKTYHALSPFQAIDLGISAIYQEFNQIPYLTVAENIFYGCEIMKGIFRDTRAMNAETKKMCEEMGLDINPKKRVSELGIAYQQVVEIVKAVSKNSKLLIMDEPSAPLTEREIGFMFKIMRLLKERGVTIIYISHRLEEVFEICDKVSVMRDGEYIITKDVKDTSKKELISYMVGRELKEQYPCSDSVRDDIVMEVASLTTAKIKGVSFHLKKGEILGFGGLVGAGRTEVARALYGADKLISGEIRLGGRKVTIKDPASALKASIGLIPEDRKKQGVIRELKVSENITLSILKNISPFMLVDRGKEKSVYSEMQRSLRIKAGPKPQKVKQLSGGNQQKVVLAKFLATRCDVLIFDEPTRGIDVGAKQEIYLLMKELAEQGKSIIMISSEMPELIGISHRMLVMKGGEIAAELQKEEFSQETILKYAAGE